jgi:hypothetical protein
MARVRLINPPSPEQLGSPLLGQQYVAAALLARGCEVRVLDAAARYHRVGAAEIASADVAAGTPTGFVASLFVARLCLMARLERSRRTARGRTVRRARAVVVAPEQDDPARFDALQTRALGRLNGVELNTLQVVERMGS